MTAASTSPYETIALRTDDAVAVVELRRPESLNAVTAEMGRELHAALSAIAGDASVRAVVLTGAGRGFCSGADLKGLAGIPPLPSGKPDLGHLLEEVYNPLVLLMREMPQPLVAAVNGIAAGIGCSFALAW